MSWSTSTKKIAKRDVERELDNLSFPGVLEPPAYDQVGAAKRAALELLKSVPGPLVMIHLSGHANGVGWQKKEGWSDDFISVTVSQHTE